MDQNETEDPEAGDTESPQSSQDVEVPSVPQQHLLGTSGDRIGGQGGREVLGGSFSSTANAPEDGKFPGLEGDFLQYDFSQQQAVMVPASHAFGSAAMPSGAGESFPIGDQQQWNPLYASLQSGHPTAGANTPRAPGGGDASFVGASTTDLSQQQPQQNDLMQNAETQQVVMMQNLGQAEALGYLRNPSGLSDGVSSPGVEEQAGASSSSPTFAMMPQHFQRHDGGQQQGTYSQFQQAARFNPAAMMQNVSAASLNTTSEHSGVGNLGGQTVASGNQDGLWSTAGSPALSMASTMIGASQQQQQQQEQQQQQQLNHSYPIQMQQGRAAGNTVPHTPQIPMQQFTPVGMEPAAGAGAAFPVPTAAMPAASTPQWQPQLGQQQQLQWNSAAARIRSESTSNRSGVDTSGVGTATTQGAATQGSTSLPIGHVNTRTVSSLERQQLEQQNQQQLGLQQMLQSQLAELTRLGMSSGGFSTTAGPRAQLPPNSVVPAIPPFFAGPDSMPMMTPAMAAMIQQQLFMQQQAALAASSSNNNNNNNMTWQSAATTAGVRSTAPPPNCTAAALASSIALSKILPTKAKQKKEKKDRPKRPLTAYNFYYRDERARLLAERSAGDLKDDDEGGDAEKDDGDDDAGATTDSTTTTTEHHTSEGTKKKRRLKPHGKMGFEEMTMAISKGWKKIEKDRKAKYETLAEAEKRRYREALAKLAEAETNDSKPPAKHDDDDDDN